MNIPTKLITTVGPRAQELLEKYFAENDWRLRQSIPHGREHQVEAYQVFLLFLLRFFLNTTDRRLHKSDPASFGWDKYWSEWCLEGVLNFHSEIGRLVDVEPQSVSERCF